MQNNRRKCDAELPKEVWQLRSDSRLHQRGAANAQPAAVELATLSAQTTAGVGRTPSGKSASCQGATVREILLQFCLGTSLRGIPRIVSADTASVRFLWLLFVSLLFIACSINLYFIVKLYFTRDVVQLPGQAFRPDAAFPSVTVCNQVPLSLRGHRLINARGWRPPREFWQAVWNQNLLSAGVNLTRAERRNLQVYAPGFLSLNAYFANIPLGFQPAELGFSQRELIRNCFLLIRDLSGEPPVKSPKCADMGRWRRIYHQNWLNCFTYTVSEDIRDPIIELEMRLFLGHDLEVQCDDCMKMDVNTQVRGATIVLHPSGSFPDVTRSGFNAYPGTLTQVRFETINWTRLGHPYGSCSLTAPSTLNIGGETFVYSRDACLKRLGQLQIRQQCNCTFAFLLHSAANQSRLCERLDGDINNFSAKGLSKAVSRTRCAMKRIFQGAHSHCPQPCNYQSYQASTTQTQWPRQSMQLHLFESELLRNSAINLGRAAPNNRSEWTLEDEVREAYSEVRRRQQVSPAVAVDYLIRTGLVSRSFVTVRVTRDDFDVAQIVDKPVQTLASTIGQIGGLLSMWLGLTLIWFVELMELSLRLMRLLCRSLASSGAATAVPPCEQEASDSDDDAVAAENNRPDA